MRIIKHGKQPKTSNAYLIEGLPGIGNVARICADYLIDKLKAKKIMSLYSKTLPNYVFVNDDNFANMPCVDFYHSKVGKKDLIFLVGDVQPMEDQKSHKLTEEILNACKPFKVKTILTLGGIGLRKQVKKVRVHAAVTDKKYVKELKKLGVVFEGNKTVSVIVGAAGTLLGWGAINGLKGFSLLAETLTSPGYVGIRSARAILEVLMKYFNLKISLKGLDKEIKEFEKFSQQRMRMIKKKILPKNLQYIG